MATPKRKQHLRRYEVRAISSKGSHIRLLTDDHKTATDYAVGFPCAAMYDHELERFEMPEGATAWPWEHEL